MHFANIRHVNWLSFQKALLLATNNAEKAAVCVNIELRVV